VLEKGPNALEKRRARSKRSRALSRKHGALSKWAEPPRTSPAEARRRGWSGLYAYPPDAISPACGTVVVQLFSEKAPNVPVNHVLSAATINRIWTDFDAYRAKAAVPTP